MVRRLALALLLALASLGAAACSDGDEPTRGSENRSDTPSTATSGDVPHNNPSSGETGTDGTDTGSR